MFVFLIWLTVAIAVIGMLYAYAGSKDVFHPLMFISPMMMFIYAWMPMKLHESGGLDGFFQPDQLVFIQTLNLAGILCFILGCLSVGCRLPAHRMPEVIEPETASGLIKGGAIVGAIGLAAWAICIVNVGGIHDAFSRPYSGGWDDNGYIRDGSLLLYPAFLLVLEVMARWRRVGYVLLLAAFLVPSMLQAAFTSRRGPTFMIGVMLAMGWYLDRGKRPSLITAAAAGLCLGSVMLFLVANRGSIYLGSDATSADLKTDVTEMVEKPDTGNEYIYGAGSILSAEERKSFYWGRRYLAQLLIRPIPSVVWANKYEDVGLPEMLRNAGTGEGFSETLGWRGAEGAAPGVVADLWLEFRWFSMIGLWLLGYLYGWLWRKSQTTGGHWVSQYVVMAGISVYLVMQTMEAVVFRALLLSVPIWYVWRCARRQSGTTSPNAGRLRFFSRRSFIPYEFEN
jgi:hypothetical protein